MAGTIEKMKRPNMNCVDIGFEHYWECNINSFVYLTNPIQYPPFRRKCKNCGLVQEEVTVQKEIKEWKIVDD